MTSAPINTSCSYIESDLDAGPIQCYYRKIAEYYSELVAVTRYIQKHYYKKWRHHTVKKSARRWRKTGENQLA